MSDRPDRQRIQPTLRGRARLLAAVEVAGAPHEVDSGALGEFAMLVVAQGRADANAAFPDIAAHLVDGCSGCAGDFRELLAALAEPDPAPPAPVPPHGHTVGDAPSSPPASSHRDGGQADGASFRRAGTDASGIYATDLPDVRADEEEAARRRRLRRVRDWLLVAAAAAILLIGLSLVGMAYLANQRPNARLGLTPLEKPAVSPTSAAGRAGPTDMSCPATHPIKGNRASMLYHQPGGFFYDQTRPEDCFESPASAEAAGFRRSQR